MSSNPPGTGTQANTFTFVQGQTQVKVYSYEITQSAAVEFYIHEDLEQFVKDRNIDLPTLLCILPGRRSYTDEQLIQLLCADIGHMLRDSLITRVHFLLYDPQIDASTQAYPLFYQATYEVTLQRGVKQQGPQRLGELLAPPQNIPRDAGFAILLEWHPNSDMDRRQGVIYPSYNLNWVSPQSRYDPTSLVRYREGSLTADGATIVNRSESTTPGALKSS